MKRFRDCIRSERTLYKSFLHYITLWWISSVCGKCWCGSELEAGWRILVGNEFQRKGAAELKERITVSSLTGGRRKVMTDAE